jgi:hypothetical protein
MFRCLSTTSLMMEYTTLYSHLDLGLDNAILVWPAPYTSNLEPSFPQQLGELMRTPLHARVNSHHSQVEPRLHLRDVHIRQHQVVNDELGISWRHGIAQMLQDLKTVLIGPVVQDVVEEVDAST